MLHTQGIRLGIIDLAYQTFNAKQLFQQSIHNVKTRSPLLNYNQLQLHARLQNIIIGQSEPSSMNYTQKVLSKF